MKKTVIFEKWLGNSLLQMVKRIKDFSNMGLKDSKEFYDNLDRSFRNNIPVIVTENTLEYHILVMLKTEGFMSFNFSENTKKENHRVIAKRSKEYEKAKAWANSLHPNKQAMINLLIREENGL